VLTTRERILTEQLNEANETILQLRESLRPTILAYYRGVQLSKTETNLVDAMRHEGVRSYDYLTAQMGVDVGRRTPASLAVVICRLRKKLAQLNVTIENQYGVGFSMTPASIATMGTLRRPRSAEQPADARRGVASQAAPA
jgi:DNA-binding response OmpR family regulator